MKTVGEKKLTNRQTNLYQKINQHSLAKSFDIGEWSSQLQSSLFDTAYPLTSFIISCRGVGLPSPVIYWLLAPAGRASPNWYNNNTAISTSLNLAPCQLLNVHVVSSCTVFSSKVGSWKQKARQL